MPAVTFVHPDGRKETLEVAVGTSLMQAAIAAQLDGIVGECGGSAMCATCHVYVDDAFADRLPAQSEVEDSMLDSVMSERKPTSRLSCQLQMTEELDGLIVRLPETQV